MKIAGIGNARRLIARDGTPIPLGDFRRVVKVNLIGATIVENASINGEVIRLDGALRMAPR